MCGGQPTTCIRPETISAECPTLLKGAEWQVSKSANGDARPGPAAHRVGDDAAEDRQAVLLRGLALGQDDRARAVGELRGVAGGGRAALLERGRELGEALQRRVRAEGVVLGDGDLGLLAGLLVDLEVGFGRIVVSATEVPNMLTNLV